MSIEKTVVKTVALRTFDRAFKHQIQKAGIILNSQGKIQFMEDMVEISDECLMPLITKVKKLVTLFTFKSKYPSDIEDGSLLKSQII